MCQGGGGERERLKERAQRDAPGIYIILYFKNILERNFSTMCLGLLPVLTSLHKHRVASVNKTKIISESRAEQAQELQPNSLPHIRRKGDHISVEHFQ